MLMEKKYTARKNRTEMWIYIYFISFFVFTSVCLLMCHIHWSVCHSVGLTDSIFTDKSTEKIKQLHPVFPFQQKEELRRKLWVCDLSTLSKMYDCIQTFIPRCTDVFFLIH